MTQIVERSATWMAGAVREREVSAVELVDAHAARIDERDGAINALVLPRLEAAREEAAEADAAVARGEEVFALHGVPFTAKDPLAVAGMRAPNGSKLLADHVSEADCAPVRRMRAAGAILLGKTNVSEFSMWWDSVNELFGATANPHDPTRTAGGSSGGEAAAIASGMSPLGLGSDLGGSIRNPCHFTGVFGLKPGRDTVPFAEHVPLPAGPGVRLMGVVGPMARFVEDLELALLALATPRLAAAQRPARIAVFEEDGLQPVSRDCRAAVRRVAAVLADAGYATLEAAPPNAAEVRGAFDQILGTEVGSAMPAVVGDRGAGSPRTCRRCSPSRAASHPTGACTSTPPSGSRAARSRPTSGSRATRSRCARRRPRSRRRCVAPGRRRSTACRRARAASSRSRPTRARSGCPRSACR